MTLRINEENMNETKEIIELARELENRANANNVIHVFDDGGYRELVLMKMFGLTKIPGRHGDDGIDPLTGKKYELKTVNLVDTSGKLRMNPGITTCHHVNHDIIERYKAVAGFLIGLFYVNTPARIYELPTQVLDAYCSTWEARLRDLGEGSHINNPKIKFTDVLNHGILHYRDSRFDHYIEIPANKRDRLWRKGDIANLDLF